MTAGAATAKTNPAYARFSVDVVTGDIDGDDRDDAVLQYPIGLRLRSIGFAN